MARDSEREPSDIDRQIRAIELKNEAQDLVGGKMTVHEADDIDPSIAEQFWENVVNYEKAPRITILAKLERAGVEAPDPEGLSDEAVSLHLWRVIDGLARLRVFLESTNHLSDRELYVVLRSELLLEDVADTPVSDRGSIHTSPIGSGSEEDMQIYHRYYADNRFRRSWMKQFPDYDMPPKQKPPYDRDRHLPTGFP
jgi:hypothetical protein